SSSKLSNAGPPLLRTRRSGAVLRAKSRAAAQKGAVYTTMFAARLKRFKSQGGQGKKGISHNFSHRCFDHRLIGKAILGAHLPSPHSLAEWETKPVRV